MEANSFFDLLLQNIYNTSLLEIIAVVFGLLSVWYSKKVNILVFPTGIVSVLIYVYICFIAKLYADMGINGVYFIMSVYGWYHWTHKPEGKLVVPVQFAGLKLNIISAVATLFSFGVLSYVLSNFTDSNVPYWDSFTTAIFIVGMLLMALKKVENWIYWIIGDVVSIPLYFYKGLVFTSLQFSIFLIIAVMGYVAWRKKALDA
jgi:nicotinamide mononucleotide transporter